MLINYKFFFLILMITLYGCSPNQTSTSVQKNTVCTNTSESFKQIENSWYFKTDPTNSGLANKWYLDKNSTDDWLSINPGAPWENSGVSYDGVAWYKTQVVLPDWSQVFLGFGNIDDYATLWINNIEVGSWTNDESKAVLVNLYEYGTPGTKLDISFRILDNGGFGGIKQPVIVGNDPRSIMSPLQYTSLLSIENPDWPLPSWSKSKPYSWTMTGNANVYTETLVSSDGSVAPWATAPRAELWLYHPKESLLAHPDLHDISFSLFESNPPIPQWHWQSKEISISNLVFSNKDSVRWKVTISNTADYSVSFAIMLAVLPLATNADIAPVCDITTHKNNQVWINGRPFIASNIEPAQMGVGRLEKILSDALNGTVTQSSSLFTNDTKDGSALWKYPLNLSPRQSTQIEFIFPNDPDATLDNSNSSFDKDLNDTLSSWEYKQTHPIISVPDKYVQNALNASLGYLLLSMDPDGPHPGPLAHDAVWVRDSAYTGLALLQYGYENLVKTTIDTTFQSQETDGRIPPIRGDNVPWQDNEWDSQGQSIFLASEYYSFTKNKLLLNEWYPNINKSANFIIDLISSSPETAAFTGLLPPSKSAEDLGPATWHHYWDNFWSVAGLEHASFVASTLGKHNDASLFLTEAHKLRKSILQSITNSMGPLPPYIPGSLENRSGSAMARGSVPAIWPTEVLSPNSDLIQRSFDYYHKLWVDPDNGGFRHLEGQYWPYGGIELAHAYLKIGRSDVLHQILSWTLQNQTLPGTYAWAEQVNPSNGGFSGGDMPHAWASADYVSLIREMLINEQDTFISLFEGTPLWWFTDNRTVTIQNAPTHFGTISVHTYGNLTIDNNKWLGKLHLDVSGDSPPNGYQWKLPQTPSKLSGPDGTTFVDGNLLIPNKRSNIILYFN